MGESSGIATRLKPESGNFAVCVVSAELLCLVFLGELALFHCSVALRWMLLRPLQLPAGAVSAVSPHWPFLATVVHFSSCWGY